MKQILLTKGMVAIVDDEDFDSLSEYRWHALESKWGFYACRHSQANEQGYPNKYVYMHRQILGLLNSSSDVLSDHVNGNKLDNRRSNLRVATRQQNSQSYRSKSSNTTSRFRGVAFDKSRGLWMAKVKHNGKEKYLGRFTSEEVAASVYNFHAQRFFGQYASLNSI